jgi:hypothetical protein
VNERDERDASSDVVVDVGTGGAVRDERGARWGGDELGDGFEPRKRVGDDDGTGEAVVSIERVGFRR